MDQETDDCKFLFLRLKVFTDTFYLDSLLQIKRSEEFEELTHLISGDQSPLPVMAAARKDTRSSVQGNISMPVAVKMKMGLDWANDSQAVGNRDGGIITRRGDVELVTSSSQNGGRDGGCHCYK